MTEPSEEVLREARALTIAACRITGWDGVAARLEKGWTPEPGTREADLLESYSTLLSELSRLRAEVEVFRRALEAIVSISDSDEEELWAVIATRMARIARTALGGAQHG
jgi:hypothetical protein